MARTATGVRPGRRYPPFPGWTVVTVSSCAEPWHAIESYEMYSGTVWLGGMTASQVAGICVQAEAG
ncbi:MAG TPA: hypothetical protein VEJ42_07090 [Streptosporangiaceae bacterium]|nr:hypothetical protein [Streptosporangiaceae bacterium]